MKVKVSQAFARLQWVGPWSLRHSQLVVCGDPKQSVSSVLLCLFVVLLYRFFLFPVFEDLFFLFSSDLLLWMVFLVGQGPTFASWSSRTRGRRPKACASASAKASTRPWLLGQQEECLWKRWKRWENGKLENLIK